MCYGTACGVRVQKSSFDLYIFCILTTIVCSMHDKYSFLAQLVECITSVGSRGWSVIQVSKRELSLDLHFDPLTNHPGSKF